MFVYAKVRSVLEFPQDSSPDIAVAEAAAGVDGSAGAQERHRRRQDALRGRQPGPGEDVSAGRGADPGRLRHHAVTAAHQSAHAA